MEINEIFKKYVADPILAIVNVQPDVRGLPTNAYMAIEEIHDDGTATTKTFAHIESVIEAEEAEEIGVEHLLRDIKDNAVSDLSTDISRQLMSLKGLDFHLSKMKKYLERVASGELPINQPILSNLQDIFNLMPNITDQETIKAFAVTRNDELLMIYLSSISRAIISLHDLIDNKIENIALEKNNSLDEQATKEVISAEIK